MWVPVAWWRPTVLMLSCCACCCLCGHWLLLSWVNAKRVMLLNVFLVIRGLWLAGLNVALVRVLWPLNGRLWGEKRAQRRWQLLPGAAVDWGNKESCMIPKEMTWWPGELGCLLDTVDPTQTSSFRFHLQSNRKCKNLPRAHSWKIRGQKIILCPVSCDFVSRFWALIQALNMFINALWSNATYFDCLQKRSDKNWPSLLRIGFSFFACKQVWKE